MGLRPSIFRLVQSVNLQTYLEVVNRALVVEKGEEIAKEERKVFDRVKGKRHAAKGSSKSNSRRLPKHSRSQSRERGYTSSRGALDHRRLPCCVICGGSHFAPQCPQHGGKCFLCGQESHFRLKYSRGSSIAPSSASAPTSPGQSQGTPPAHYQAV